MRFKVRIEPSGHVFTALPQESLLEAALRSGINLVHSCSNGSCGDCRVRILQGQIGEHMHGDFHFTEREKAQGYAMLCTTRADSDLVIEAHEAGSPRDMPLQQIRVKLTKNTAYGDKVRVLELRTPRTQTLSFLAGQSVSLQLDDLPAIELPIASCPCNGMYLHVHLHRDDTHTFVTRVFEGLRTGTGLELHGPLGETTLDDDSRRPLLMVAHGTAFAPIKSIAEHAINLELGQPIRLFWLADEATGHYLENHCRAWAEVLDDYAYFPVSVAAGVPTQAELTDLIARLIEAIGPLSEADVYLAGPHAFRDTCKTELIRLGADAARLFVFN